MAQDLPQKVIEQITAAGLPTLGQQRFKPQLTKNRKGETIIKKAAPAYGPKKGKLGFVDDQGRIWIKDRAHSGLPDHWDVQENDGTDYFRVDTNGEEIVSGS